MPALAINFPRAASDFESEWTPIAAAAPLLGMHADSLGRLCRSKLVFECKAVLTAPPGGGQEQYYIRKDFHPALSNPTNAAIAYPTLQEFSDKQQTAALQRLDCVTQFRAALQYEPGLMRDIEPRVIARLRQQYPELHISRSRLHCWHKSLNCKADLVNLVDCRGGDQYRTTSPAAWSAFRDLYLHENQPTIRQCWKQVQRLAFENRWQWISYASCSRRLNDEISPEDQAFHRTPVMYREQLAPYIAQNEETWKAGECYIGDHKQLDMFCRCGKNVIRPWATIWMCWRTRKITGWILSDSPNSTTILGALRHAIKDESNMGGPSFVQIDNGKDYDAFMYHGQTKKERRARIKPAVNAPRAMSIFGALNIEAHFATPFNPNGKARLERWFRTLGPFCKTFATYTGDSSETRPENLNEILDDWKRVAQFETVRARLADHIAGYNADPEHSRDDLSEGGKTLSPYEAFAAWATHKKVPADPDAVDLLMMQWGRPTTVGRNGISINLCGQTLHYGQFTPELSSFKALSKADRKPVNVSFDPHDLGTIRVYDSALRFVCTAPMNAVGGLVGKTNRQALATVTREKAAYARSLKHVAEYSITSTLTSEEHLLDAAIRQEQEAKQLEPAPLRMTTTPLDGQAREIEKQEFRKAVGAESMSAPVQKFKPLDFSKVRPRPRDDENFKLDPARALIGLKR
jgi:transposase InsO family protein